MGKTLFTITLIIFANLLAFLFLGHILDAIFETGANMKLIALVVSIPVLGIIMYLKAGKLGQGLQNIPHKKNER